MALHLKANTAVDVLIGPFVDKTDGNTTEDGLTLTRAEIKLSKNGQALTQKTETTSAAFDDDGYYNCMFDATDTNTEGQLVLIVHQSANALPVRHEYSILSEAAWDSLYAAKDTGFMDVNITSLDGDVLDAASIADDAFVAANFATGAFTADAFAADALVAATFAAASLNGKGDWNTTTPPTVNEVRDGILDDATRFSGANIDAAITSRGTADTGDAMTLTAAATSAQLVDDILDEAQSGHVATGSIGRSIQIAGTILVDTTVASVPSGTTFTLTAGSTVNDFYKSQAFYITSGTGAGQSRTVASYTGATKTVEVDEAFATALAIGDQIVIQSSHHHTVDEIATAAVDEWETQAQADPTGFHVNVLEIAGTGQTGNDNGADINAILIDTTELQEDWTNGGRLDLILDAILAMLDDPRAEPGQGAPAVNPDAMSKLDYVYKFLRNKSTFNKTTGAASLYNDAGAVVDQKATGSDDGTTFTKGEWGTGP